VGLWLKQTLKRKSNNENELKTNSNIQWSLEEAQPYSSSP
jgi:hypothetical protein